jgi:transcription elongation factor Elf1
MFLIVSRKNYICLKVTLPMISNCPECKKELHKGQHKFSDGMYEVFYCKDCGFRKETPIS